MCTGTAAFVARNARVVLMNGGLHLRSGMSSILAKKPGADEVGAVMHQGLGVAGSLDRGRTIRRCPTPFVTCPP
jgi:hypothetical protein